MQDSLAQIAHTVDSLSAVVKHIERVQGWAIWLPPVLAALLASGLTGYMQIRIRKQNRHDDQEQADRSYAAVWGAVMEELWQALDGMSHQVSQICSAYQISVPEIELVDGLRMSYLSVSRHPKVSATILRMYINIGHYRDSYHEMLLTLKEKAKGYVDPRKLLLQNTERYVMSDPSLKIVRDHYPKMVNDFEYCVTEFYEFLEETGQKNDYHFNTLNTINYGEHRPTQLDG